MKRKKSDRTKWMDKADAAYSYWIRQSHADEDGFVKCFTCDIIRHWKRLDCGHWQKRQHMATRYHEENTKPQDKGCNNFKQGNDVVFRANLVELYGEKKVEMIEIKSHNYCRMGLFELKMIYNIYINKLKANGYETP